VGEVFDTVSWSLVLGGRTGWVEWVLFGMLDVPLETVRLQILTIFLFASIFLSCFNEFAMSCSYCVQAFTFGLLS
jgi:hypothetical protein